MIMAGQLSVARGAGELGGVRDYGENGSIHQSVSNEGKNWSKSSRWKSYSAWGGLSVLSVSRVSGFMVLHCTTAPQKGDDCYRTGSATLKYLKYLVTVFSAFVLFFSCYRDLPTFHFL